MNRVNFHSAKNVEVPDAWIETALRLSPPRKRRITPFVIGTAASVAAITAGVLIFTSKLSVRELPVISSASSVTDESTSPTVNHFIPSVPPTDTVSETTTDTVQEPKEESVSAPEKTEYNQSVSDRQGIDNAPGIEPSEPTNQIAESSAVSASEPKETVTEEVTAATSYPFVPPATGYISGHFAESPDNIFMGILVYQIDERFKDSQYLFCHITEHGNGLAFCEKYAYREFVNVVSKDRDVYRYSPIFYDISLDAETIYDLEFYDEWGHSEIFSGFQFQSLYGEIELNLKEVNDD